MKSFKRIIEITGGSILIIIGIVLIFIPIFTGAPILIAGIFLISPYHGRRIVWHLGKIWKRIKMFWYSWKFKRTVKRKIFRRAKMLKRKIIRKK